MAAPGNTTANRDGFSSKLGFILACVGSAVGMGNIWLFPVRMATYGGAFLLVYLIFDIVLEMCIRDSSHRTARSKISGRSHIRLNMAASIPSSNLPAMSTPVETAHALLQL